MSNIKPPQHDLYERIARVTVDGRTKAYKEAVARLKNAAEIRQQRKDAAALSQGHSDGHHPEDSLSVDERITTAMRQAGRAAMKKRNSKLPKPKPTSVQKHKALSRQREISKSVEAQSKRTGGYITHNEPSSRNVRRRQVTNLKSARKKAAARKTNVSAEYDPELEEGGIVGALGQGAAGAVGSYLGSKATVAGEKKLRKTKTGEKALKKLDMGEDIDESPAVAGIRMGARLVGRGARQLRNPTTRSMGKKTIGHGARVAKKGISKSGAAAGKTIRKDADIVGKAISQTSAGKGVSKGIKKVTPKTAIGREAAKGAAIGGSVGTAAGAAVNKARGRTAFTGKEKKTEKTESLEIEKAIEERVLEILGERGIDFDKNKSESIKKEGLVGAAALVGTGVAIGRKSKERKLKVQKGTTHWDNNK